MKNKINFYRIITIISIFGFSIVACGENGDPSGPSIPPHTHVWDWATYTTGSGLRECQTAGCTEKARVGDTGPAGGKIIYANATAITAYTANYLEAAPVNQGTSLAWASSEYLSTNIPGTGTAIGTGKDNTAILTLANAPAAKACTDYRGGDKDDWFLPSKDELIEMHKARTHLGISSGSFWSSSQYDDYYAWYQYFNGSENWYLKNSNYNVRAVRAF